MKVDSITTLDDIDRCGGRLPEPIINREGYYHDRDKNYTWFESLNDGEMLAWEYDSERFCFELDILTAWFWHTKEKHAALKAVVDAKIATKDQRRLYCSIRDAYELRRTYRDAKKRGMGMVRRIKEKLKKRKQ
jgi:hypothetical protein